MLSFTRRGAVSSPQVLQLRIGADDPGALRAGAPVPSRPLTPAEAIANVDHFTIGRDTPRTRPCTRLALSGVGGAVGLVEVVRHARARGVGTVVLHGRCAEIEGEVDLVALRCREPADVVPPASRWSAVVPLDREGLATLSETVQALLGLAETRRPERVVLAWPFPGDRVELPPVGPTADAARAFVQLLETGGVPASLRGLPPCLDGSDEGRTANRFYVDADHQLDDALLFVPDVVQFLKPDSCRVCARSVVCDGVPARWLERGVVGPLEPLAR